MFHQNIVNGCQLCSFYMSLTGLAREQQPIQQPERVTLETGKIFGVHKKIGWRFVSWKHGEKVSLNADSECVNIRTTAALL